MIKSLQNNSDIVKNKYKYYFYCLLIICIFKLPVFVMGFRVPKPLVGDPYLHLLISYLPFGWHSFTGVFPIGCTIVYKIFNYNLITSQVIQFIYSSIAFAFPLYIINYYDYKLSKLNKSILNVALLLFVSSIAVTSWDNGIGSDSLTLSSLVISLSMVYLCYINQISLGVKLTLIVSMSYFILLRDSNYIIAVYIIIFILLCLNLSYKFKVLCIFTITPLVILMSISAKEFRSYTHMRDILALYIIDNDSQAEVGKQYYQWYKDNTNMPDIKQEFTDCKLYELTSSTYELNGLPTYPFSGNYSSTVSPQEATRLTSFLTGCTVP